MLARNHASADEEPCTDYDRPTFGTQPTHASRNRRSRIETDSGEYEFVPAFPVLSAARTTFHATDVERNEWRWERLWCLHHNRGHAWDDHAKTTARNDATHRRRAAILQQCDVPEWGERVATSRVIHEDLTGFSRHYAGADGACIGFALLELYDDPDEARESFFAHRAADVIPGLDSDDVDGLVDYVFRKYRGAS